MLVVRGTSCGSPRSACGESKPIIPPGLRGVDVSFLDSPDFAEFSSYSLDPDPQPSKSTATGVSAASVFRDDTADPVSSPGKPSCHGTTDPPVAFFFR